MTRWLANERVALDGAAGLVDLTVWDSAGARAKSANVKLSREDAEQLACALLQAAGWDTAAMLAGPGGRAPVFVGELELRGDREVKP